MHVKNVLFVNFRIANFLVQRCLILFDVVFYEPLWARKEQEIAIDVTFSSLMKHPVNECFWSNMLYQCAGTHFPRNTER